METTIFEESGPRSALALPPRTVLHHTYEIGRVLGKGGFGITYAAFDQNLQVPVAIKEYLPAQVAGRGTDRSTVQPHSGGDDDVFEHGLEAFLSEAQTLAQFEHPNIVGVKAFFRANGTGYLVMPFYEGRTLDAYLNEQGGPMPHDEALTMIAPVIAGLAAVHERGILHRDIKPQNVYLTDSGGTVLLDFGAARIAFGEESQSLSAVLTPGYAPFEQYSRRGHQGPWTDVYATAAMLYRMVTGQKPPEATDRLAGEPLPPPHLANPALPPTFSAAISTALAVQPKDRPQTIEALRQSLMGGDATVLAQAGGDETVVAGSDETILTDPLAPGPTVAVPPPLTQKRPPVPPTRTALVLTAARDVRFRVDDGSVQPLSSGQNQEIAVAPGAHRIEMSFNGVKRTAQVTLAPGERRAITLDLPGGSTGRGATRRGISRPPRSGQPRRISAVWWALGGAGALLLVLIAIGLAVEGDTPADNGNTNIQGVQGNVFDDGGDSDDPGPNEPVDELALAIQATEADIRAEIAAEGGIQPTSSIGAIRFTEIGVPVDIQGALAPGDGILDSGAYADLYMFQVNRANYLFAELTSDEFDVFFVLLGPDGELVIQVDDTDGLDAIVDTELPQPGIYTLVVTSAHIGETGRYSLSVTPDYLE